MVMTMLLNSLHSTLSVAEIEYNTVKPYFHYLFLSKGYEPFLAHNLYLPNRLSRYSDIAAF